VRLRPGYLAATLLLLLAEILIALFVRDSLIRPYGGDALAVVLMYTSLRGVSRLSVLQAAVAAVAIAFVIEFGQLFDIAGRMGLGHSTIARLILGQHFEAQDLITYVVGALGALSVEWLRAQRRSTP
jgi:hypothetical protein